MSNARIDAVRGATPTGSKLVEESALLSCLKDGMTIGIGGFGLDRKPMSLVRTISRSPVRELTLETFAGGFDIEVLVAANKVKRISACHVGLDHFGLAPIFRAARQSGQIEFEEWSEWTQLAAWRAAAEGVPYTIVRIDTKSDLLRVNPRMQVTQSPFDGREVTAIKAPSVDLAILHAEAAHPDGWAIAVGDPYLDDILARAAKMVVLSTERIMDDGELEERHRDVHLLASYVDAIVLARHGALPGSCVPLYLIDLPPIRRYLDASAAGVNRAEDLIDVITRVAPSSVQTDTCR